MSKFTESLKALRIFNASDFAGPGVVYVAYIPALTGRMSRYAQWCICRPGYQTDPNAHWMDYGHKVFPVAGKDRKQPVLEEALAWAGAKYKITDWAKSPFGTWMSKPVLESRLAELKAQLS